MAKAGKQSDKDQTVGSADVRLLADVPSKADEFEANAHKRVASAIAELVSSEPGGRVIGLEGSWGSGKSTVVELVSAALQPATGTGPKDEGIRMVVFDAWSHQGDPLRR